MFVFVYLCLLHVHLVLGYCRSGSGSFQKLKIATSRPVKLKPRVIASSHMSLYRLLGFSWRSLLIMGPGSCRVGPIHPLAGWHKKHQNRALILLGLILSAYNSSLLLDFVY